MYHYELLLVFFAVAASTATYGVIRDSGYCDACVTNTMTGEVSVYKVVIFFLFSWAWYVPYWAYHVLKGSLHITMFLTFVIFGLIAYVCLLITDIGKPKEKRMSKGFLPAMFDFGK